MDNIPFSFARVEKQGGSKERETWFPLLYYRGGENAMKYGMYIGFEQSYRSFFL
jgi:hypothetical protein